MGERREEILDRLAEIFDKMGVTFHREFIDFEATIEHFEDLSSDMSSAVWDMEDYLENGE